MQTSTLSKPLFKATALVSMIALNFAILLTNTEAGTVINDYDASDAPIRDVLLVDFKYKVYPNPTKGIVNLEFENSFSDTITVEITSVTGQQLYTYQCYGILDQQKIVVDLTRLPLGIYFIKTIIRRKVFIEKIVKIGCVRF